MFRMRMLVAALAIGGGVARALRQRDGGLGVTTRSIRRSGESSHPNLRNRTRRRTRSAGGPLAWRWLVLALPLTACTLTISLDGLSGSDAGKSPGTDGGSGDASVDTGNDRTVDPALCTGVLGQFCSDAVLSNTTSGTGACSTGACRACAAGYLARGAFCIPKPVAYWTFDEGSGLVAADSSGNGLTGTLTHGPTWVTGHVGTNALSFDGIDDQVVFGNAAQLNFGTGSFSYTVLVYVTSSAGPFDMAWFKGGSSTAEVGYDMELGTGDWGAGVSDGVRNAFASFGGPTVKQWNRLVAVMDRGPNQLRTYRNGALVSTVDVSAFGTLSSSRGAYVGTNEIGAFPFKGVIDDVMVFNRALTPAEVNAL